MGSGYTQLLIEDDASNQMQDCFAALTKTNSIVLAKTNSSDLLLYLPNKHIMTIVTFAFALSQLTSAHGTLELAVQSDRAKMLDDIVVVGRRQNLIGAAIAASQGVVGPEQLKSRALLRTGDLVEFVPGMVATQHSGNGKANQYFLRGFNLDHATDFATFVEDMPVNLRSHGHGQGYSDLNFLIPEVVGELRYRKGPYSADVGDFSAAGSAHFRIANDLGTPKVQATLGSFGYQRGVSTATFDLSGATLSYGVEAQGYTGPWAQVDEEVAKKSLIVKYARDVGEGRARLLLMAYDNRWNSADQIPERAVTSGLISELGSVDDSLGGDSSRYSLSGGLTGVFAAGVFDVSAYAIDYDLRLFSNFTYLLDDPLNGDQFSQFDSRKIYGGEFSENWLGSNATGQSWKLRVGGDFRSDLIDGVGLSRTRARQLLAVVRADRVHEVSASVFIDGEYQWSKQWRSYLGARLDSYRFDVNGLDCAGLANLNASVSARVACDFNGGKKNAHITAPKASLIYTPFDVLELNLSYGKGFHSNDARGITTRIDPSSGESVEPVTPIVDAFGSEFGARVFLTDQLNATLSLWQLNVDSELLFVGDAGTTEASRPSRRKGVELGVYYFAAERWNLELEANYTQTQFRDANPLGNRIPGSIPLIISAGINGQFDGGYSASARIRHFGRYPLIEDGALRSAGSTLVNFKLAKTWQQFSASLDLLNAFDSKDHDVDYYYASRLPGESAGVDDLHFHIFEPRSIRLTLGYQW